MSAITVFFMLSFLTAESVKRKISEFEGEPVKASCMNIMREESGLISSNEHKYSF